MVAVATEKHALKSLFREAHVSSRKDLIWFQKLGLRQQDKAWKNGKTKQAYPEHG